MINVEPYQKAFTEEYKQALIARNVPFFHAEIKRLARLVSLRDGNFDHSIRYDHVLSQLQVCLALLDGLIRRGETTQLILDMVNF